ncbi:hypothetical protein BX616_000525 [Lobosporangium transversale]|uniref:Golgi apparatus membrane protein TVP38 n=1 Tax=Lobosporangium transversale TaxID=64571 RepID=A0A1Y2GQ38_9FUNG|nr:snare associated Golgi protein-domain-containing protein [Lobosporangium transversale]KAF9907114.1 hypothetical protein BX616_000525 [Lobosporangium transversale]ORZ13939.1 snare associated Golgi protein-domain-containing protein [Lobosporangium transversale]|eukprot:XP_021880723.1 snare associated Golgi protein-domain-containing protein [Lobosporangium transversale]
MSTVFLPTTTVTATTGDEDGEPISSSSATATHHHHSHLRHGSSASLSSLISFSSPSSPSASRLEAKETAASSHLSGPQSIPIRLIQYVISILLQIRGKLPIALRPWFWVGLWLIFAVFGLAIFVGFHTLIFQLLESIATFIKGLGRAGPLIIMLGLFLTAFPPIFGYSSLVTMSGYVYGFAFGLFIAYTSALLGSVACFYLCRRWFKVQVRTLMAKKQGMKSVVKAVEKRGFKLMLLIRLAPYPFNVMNALLSATHIPLSTYTFATALSLTKLALHIYIGSTLSSLATVPPSTTTPATDTEQQQSQEDEALVDTNQHGQSLKILIMLISMALGIGVGAYVWIVAKREIAANEGIRIERRRKKRQSLRQSRASMRASPETRIPAARRGSARVGSHLLPRSSSSGGLDLLGIDLGSNGAIGQGRLSDFVGNGTLHIYTEEDEGKEDQALVGGTDSYAHTQRVSRSSTGSQMEYGSDSYGSDNLNDEDDDDMSDVERGMDDEDLLICNSTEMSIRNSFQYNRHPQTIRRTELETMDWFALNGLDISDRG